MVDFKDYMRQVSTRTHRIAPPDNTYKPYEAACNRMSKIIEAWRHRLTDKQNLFEQTNIWLLFYHDKIESERSYGLSLEGLPKDDLTLFNDFVENIQMWGWELPHADITHDRIQAIEKRIRELKDLEKQLVQVFY